MTFLQIQNRIADRLNLTSAAALTRIGISINEGYRELASSIGMATVQRVDGGATVTTAGNGVRLLTFGPNPPIEKILSIYNKAFTPPLVLTEVSYDQIENEPPVTDPAIEYAFVSQTSNTVTIKVNSLATSVFTLTADILQNLTDLAGSQVPAIPESYHNAIVFKGMEIEYDKLDKPQMAEKYEKKYEKRLGELRYFIAKSAYLDIVPGQNQQLTVSRNVPLV